MQGIYKITNIINNQCYIGKSNHIERRWADHKRLAFTSNQKEYNKALYCAIRKYGLENFIFEVIEELSDYNISGEREEYWIEFYDSYNYGYNETPGGDGGSSKGHCKGECNGRALLTEEDVIKIRTLYQEGISKSDCYELFKNKISQGGFTRVWTGQSWQHIMPEVYTSENKIRNAKLGRGKASKQNRKFSIEQVKDIRRRKDNGESPTQVFQDYKMIGSKSSFDDIWYNRTYKDIN